jgi:hypothetical protein
MNKHQLGLRGLSLRYRLRRYVFQIRQCSRNNNTVGRRITTPRKAILNSRPHELFLPIRYRMALTP